MEGIGLDHIYLTISDMEAAERFYVKYWSAFTSFLNPFADLRARRP